MPDNTSKLMRRDDDPWGRKKPDGPPDLDEMLKKFFAKLGKRPMGSGGNGGSGSSLEDNGWTFFWLALLVLFVVYVLSGIYIIQPSEQAVVTRFGRYQRTVGPGPHWIPRVIEQKRSINTEQVMTTNHGGQMLTRDENIVYVEIAVQYRVRDPKAYLFNVVDPRFRLQQVTESALRQVVGRSDMEFVLTIGRSQIPERIKQVVEDRIKLYNSGLFISDVTLQAARAPDEVKEAFDDAIKAREDQERLINEARAYKNRVEPVAKGQAQRQLEEAEAYKQRTILIAKGDTAKFNEILPEYQAAPKVTKKRLYLQTMEEVLGNNHKLLLDSNAGNFVYLPLDQIMHSHNTKLPLIDDPEQENEPTISNVTRRPNTDNSNLRQRFARDSRS